MVSITVRVAFSLMLLASVVPARAESEIPAVKTGEVIESSPELRAKTIKLLPADTFDSPAQSALKKLALPVTQDRPPRIAGVEKNHPDLVTRLEEIRVYGRNEPEDYVGAKVSPLMQFRSRLEREVTLSPAKKVQLAFCLIGLCGIYGPEGIPLGDSPERRAEDRLIQSTLQLNSQFRGTLQ
jgi:hypothetical protein